LPEYWIQKATHYDGSFEIPWIFKVSDIEYGYQWWIPSDTKENEFFAEGVFGQFIYVNPVRNVIIVKTSADPMFTIHTHESIEVFRWLTYTFVE